MDFAYSPHRDGGTMHLASPTHPHGYRLEGTHFSSIQQLRRSLSRSPSKPSRFQLRTGRPDSPGSPISPLALARAFSPKTHKPANSPMSGFPESPLSTQAAPAVKKKFTLRRSGPFRSSPRTRTVKSPRRALVDTTDRVNAMPFVVQSAPGEENMPARRTSSEHMNAEKRYELNDKPIKFEFARRQDMSPVKASPLKRNDGLMNLNEESCTSPVAKRRSLHGPTSLSVDFENIFDQSPAPRSPKEEFSRSQDQSFNGGFAFSSPASKPHSPIRRTTSLRKSTLSQRFGGASTPRPKPTYDGEFALPGPAASASSKARNRMSLDSSLAFSSGTTQSPFRKSTFEPVRVATPQPFMRTSTGSHQPHPLSHALTPSSSSSSLVQDSPMHPPPPPPAPSTMPPPGHPFAKSLPIGATRPQAPQNRDDSYETPFSFKTAKPEPIAFSTGLLSKKNRNVDDPAEGPGKYVMPDTPSKRQSYPPAVFERSESMDTPFVKRGSSLFGKTSRPRPEFGTPSTPFSAHASKLSAESFGKGSSIFGNIGSSHQRRGSFASIDGEEPAGSPTGNHMTDSQSSADDMPPTPTKGHDGSSRRSKESSLRRKTFRQRPTLSTDTFAPPVTPTVDDYTAAAAFGTSTPHTPCDSFAPPDPSRLSISGPRRDSLSFNSSTASYFPATPTARREQGFFTAEQPVIPIGLTKNDVDESLHSRFHEVKLLDGAEGEFSKVYRVSKPVGQSPLGSPAGSQVYVVKKSKKPYLGAADREKKMREVKTLYALRGNDHVMTIHNHWEESGHLYIQTEYCEGGNLRKFLNSAGFSSRLDDFRIWKILLEMSLGVKFIHESGFIHLDLKPANILIDFEGVLKIGDFGLASPWPAPAHIDGEGDRHYLAPEALQGRYDKPADIFALGVMLAEIAGNCVIPEYGEHWQALRSGEFKNVLPSLTWSAESSTLSRDSNGDPIPEDTGASVDTLLLSDADIDPLGPVRLRSAINADEELSKAPQFMVDEYNNDSMDQVVRAMMHPDPDQRPTAEQVYHCFGCQWVEQRRRAGATVYEGNFGPGDEVLAYDDQHHFDAADMMDTS